MFVDFYELLSIDPSSSTEKIKSAFRREAMKWHPDQNPGRDTTEHMRLLLQAKFILLDQEARSRYDQEYRRFKKVYEKQEAYTETTAGNYESRDEQRFSGSYSSTSSDSKYTYTGYTVHDDVLKRWMDNAAKQAWDMLKQTLEDFKGASSAGAKAFGEKVLSGIVTYFIVSILLFIVFKACSAR